jgi:thioester reductase-like protein
LVFRVFQSLIDLGSWPAIEVHAAMKVQIVVDRVVIPPTTQLPKSIPTTAFDNVRHQVNSDRQRNDKDKNK